MLATQKHKMHPDFHRERLSPHFVYESYDKETGFFFNRGSVGFVLIANPLPGAEITAQSEIAEYIANSDNLPDGSSMQILTVGSNDISFLLNRWQNERDGHGKIFEELASKRCQFLKEKGKSDGVVKDAHLLISVTIPETNTNILNMERRREGLINSFKSIGLWVDSVDDVLLVSFLHKIWGNNKDTAVNISPYDPISEQILSSDFSMIEDDDIVVCNSKEAFICLEAEDRPEEWSLNLMDLFLGNESRKGEYIKTDYLIHVGIHILKNQSMEKGSLMAKREALEKNIKSGMGKWFPDLGQEAKDMNGAVASVQNGDRVINIYCNVILKGEVEKVRTEVQNYRSMMRRYNWNFVPTKYDHLTTMLSSMPMSLVEEEAGMFRKEIGGYGVLLSNMGRGKKTVSSESKALLPIIGEYKGDLNSPGLLLTGRRGQLKYFSQFGSELAPHLSKGTGAGLENYNICIAGVSGSGKSVCMQEIMLSTLGVGGKVFVLDYGKSFKNLCQILGGNYIEFDPSRPISINPFTDIPMGNDKRSLEARNDFLASFPITLATMAAPKHGTTDLQQTNLTKALRECWDKKANETQIDDIANWLLIQENNPVANDLGRMLFNYTKLGAYGGFFSGKAELNFDADIVVIETDHLRNFPDLMAVVIQIMITHVNNTMAKGKSNKPNLLVFDEIMKTLKNPLALEFVSEIVRIVRKYKASVVVATQLLTDFHKLGSAAESIFEGASFKLIFKQRSETLSNMSEIPMLKNFVDTDAKMRRMQSVESKKGEYGEFSIWGEGVNGDIARLRIDKFTLLLMSTNANERQLIADYRESGLDLASAINKVIEDSANAG